MASGKQGTVTLRGRFSPGDVVTLVKVAGEHVLRSEGGEEIETQTVGEEKDAPRVGYVCFSGVEVDARYFVRGLTDGRPLEVRVRGREKNDPEEVLSQPPIMPDRQRMADGSMRDEAPTKESAPQILAVAPDQRHVPKGTVQRSDTPRGEAHPVDVDAQEPVRRQEDVNGPVQMSDTPHGEATELVLGPQRQEDVPKGMVQRSSTPTGVATPFPAGDAVEQQLVRESSQARESRGEPGQAAAVPLEIKGGKMGAPTGSTQEDSEKRDAELKASENAAATAQPPIQDVAPAAGVDEDPGTDAQGQPAAEDVAEAVGAEPDDKAAKRSAASKKAAATRKRNKAKKATAKPKASKPKAEPKTSARTQTGAATTTNTTAKE